MPHPPSADRSVGRALALTVVVAGALAAWNAAYFFLPTVDDAFISLRYAWNLAHGVGLVYNAGERVEGYSNPSWTLLGALWITLGVDPLTALKWTGIALTAALPAATAWTGRQVGLGRTAAGAAALLVATDLNVAYWAPDGLETPLWTLALVLFLGACARRWDGREGLPVSALLGAFLYVTRPEAPLFLAPALAWELARHRFPGAPAGGLRASAGWVVTLLAPCLGWLGFRHAYYGDWVANTYYVKATAGFMPELFALYLSSWLLVSSPVTGLLLPFAAAFGAVRRERVILVVALAVQVVFVLRAGADWMAQNRFWVPAVPVALLLVTGATEQASEWVQGRGGRRAGLLLAGAVAALLGGQAWRHLGAEALYRGGDKGATIDIPRWTNGPKTLRERVSGGLWTGVPDRVLQVLLTVPDGATIAHSEIGLLGYVMDNPILDAYGLCDRRLSGATGERLTDVMESLRPPEFVLRRAGVPMLDAMASTSWYKEGGYAERNRWKEVWLEAPGGPGPVPPLPDDVALARLTTAVHRVPREIRFQVARIEVARRVGDPEAIAAACADAAPWFPGLAGCSSRTPAPAEVARAPLDAAAGAAVVPTPAGPPAALDTPNLGFEQVTAGRPDGWTAVPGDATAWGVVDDALTGAHAVKVEAPLWVCSPWAPTKGDIRLWGSYRTADISVGANERQGAAVSVRLERADHRQESATVKAWTGTAGWTPFDVQFPVADEFVRYRACVGINASTGTAWFDDVGAASG